MKAQLQTKNVMIDGKRTTIRLETAIWEAMEDICKSERMSRHEFCTKIEERRDGLNRAQAVRATIVNYFRFAQRQAEASIPVLDMAMVGGDD